MIFIYLSIFNYFVGAIPFSYLIGLYRGVDIRKIGSGNVGATNVWRTCGKKAGVLAYLLDILKGVFCALVTLWVVSTYNVIDGSIEIFFILYLVYIIPVIAHVFPVYLKFKGGKGVATAGGVMWVLSPWVFILCMVLFFLVLWRFKMVSIASVCTSLSFPCVLVVGEIYNDYWGRYGHTLQEYYPNAFMMSGFLIGLLITYFHKKNIYQWFDTDDYTFGNKS